MKFTLFLLAVPLLAQSAFTLSVDAGSATDPDKGGYATGGYQFTSPAIAGFPAPYRDLRAGTAFSYDLPVPNGSCSLTVRMVENRPAGTNPAANSAPGWRVFTVTANGVATEPLDLFLLAGPIVPYDRSLGPVIVSDGHLRISFTASKGNAVASGLDVSCAPTPALPFSWDPIAKVWRFDGDIHVSGFLETGAPGTPTTFTITRRDGSVCEITYDVGQVMRCP